MAVLFLPTPEFGSGVPMENCRPQWFRPVLSRDCQGLDRQGVRSLIEAYLRKQLAGVLASSTDVSSLQPS
jgi:hypothetical protein